MIGRGEADAMEQWMRNVIFMTEHGLGVDLPCMAYLVSDDE
jgi:hypothetical protein